MQPRIQLGIVSHLSSAIRVRAWYGTALSSGALHPAGKYSLTSLNTFHVRKKKTRGPSIPPRQETRSENVQLWSFPITPSEGKQHPLETKKDNHNDCATTRGGGGGGTCGFFFSQGYIDHRLRPPFIYIYIIFNPSFFVPSRNSIRNVAIGSNACLFFCDLGGVFPFLFHVTRPEHARGARCAYTQHRLHT